jgi:hypothetical protein
MHWLLVVILAFVNLPLSLALAAIFIFIERKR